MTRKYTIAILAALLSVIAAAATTQVSLLTARAGADIYQLEGHSGLRIVDSELGDFVVNWGVFDFDSPNFLYRFVKGETDYICAATPTARFVYPYMREGRKVVEQPLNLTDDEARRLRDMVLVNLEPANRVYRYNYVLDNCATRPLAMIERAIGDTIALASPHTHPADASTFRGVMKRFHANYPWYQFGIDLALGSGIDRKITLRERSFAPEILEKMMAGATRPDGTPVVSDSRVIVDSPAPTAILGPTPWIFSPMAVALLVLVISVAISVMQLRKHKAGVAARIFDTLLYTAFGLAGLLLTFLIFVSVHEATSPNWLYLWLNPLSLVIAVLVWIKRCRRLLFYCQMINFALLLALAILLAVGVQTPNPAFWPLILADGLRSAAWIVTLRRAQPMSPQCVNPCPQ